VSSLRVASQKYTSEQDRRVDAKQQRHPRFAKDPILSSGSVTHVKDCGTSRCIQGKVNRDDYCI
jgi:hypothetical protein